MADLAMNMPIFRSERALGFQKLIRRKHSNPQQQRGGKGPQLAKHLKVPQLVTIGVGSTIGAGVYVLIGTVARDRAGPSLSASFLIAGIAAALSAFCYAELASRCPSAGSAYHYAYTCVGEGIAWLIGWALILEYTVGGAAVARGISPNLGTFFGGADNLPAIFVRRTIPGVGIVVDPCAALLVLIVTVFLCRGIKESAMVQSVMTLLNLSVLVFVIVTGVYVGYKTGWEGYKQPGGFLPFGINGMLGGAATVFFSYIGFDTVASTAEEVKRPQRDLPFGIGLSLFICSSLYMAVSAVIVGIVPYQSMDPDTPMSSAFADNHLQWAMYIVAAGAVAALSTTLLGSLLPQPRILMAMSRDGLLPPLFSILNPATSIPIYSTVATGAAAAMLAFTMDVNQLSGMVSVGTLFAFTIVGIAVLIVRYVPPSDRTILAIPVPVPVTLPPLPPAAVQKPRIVPPVLPVVSEDVKQSPAFLVQSGATLQTRTNCQDVSKSVSSTGSKYGTMAPKQEKEQQSHSLGSQKETVYTPLLPKDPAEWDKIQDETRRSAAALGIFCICVGALLISFSTSLTFIPSWLRWTVGTLGGIPLGGGTFILLLIPQDEARHNFGQSGGFLCPFIPILPIISIMVNVYLLVNLESLTWIRVSIWLALGTLVYFFYGMNHSLLGQEPQTQDSEH
ncbi:hypothetical protein O6H91_02G131700 [Diphasiastrum complanatum]|uniref:Uncharacterized protein n=3 Tax=Diphasiastrum complanatum TaxID=34168 RepID=A0ACC2EKT6_DIPCM|nr:hypothetical protein O6H91_02G131700 [Diphasiastrum complanatum]KAJ7567085.1 hypothetical protein O6H91_02G131700 [Diphasiastrum complanatum]KAJ7567086.1 hypothetical protein O6H91_02G131700 [Diphasiastrum complanatum]